MPLLVFVLFALTGLASANVINNCAMPTDDVNWSYQRRFAVYAEGNLLCDGEPYKGAIVELVELDYGPGTIDDHDMLNVTVAREGKFELCGLDSEVSGLELVLRIRHNCSNRGRSVEIVSCVSGFDRPDERYYELILRNVELSQLDHCTSDEM